MKPYDLQSICDIAYKVARKFYSGNKDRSLELEDFIQEITLKLSHEWACGRRDTAWLWKVASNNAIDLLRKGNYRCAQPFDPETDSYFRSTPNTNGPDNILSHVAAEQILADIPEKIIEIGERRINGQTVTGSDRMILSRYRRKSLRRGEFNRCD